MNKTIKVLSYNICHGMDYTNAKSTSWARDWSDIRLDKTANVIKKLDADVIGLNEVYNSGGKNLNKQTETIANLSNYPYHLFGKALTLRDNCEYGNGFISKFKIIESETYKVPSPIGNERRENENEYYEDRVLVRVVIDFYGIPLSVYVTHFGLNGLEQERMASTILSCLSKEKYPHILMGDFNVEPNNEVLKPIFSKMQSSAKFFNNTQKTFATYDDKMQIDYIFFSNEFTLKSFSKVNENVSDHYPILAEATLNFN